MLHAASYKADTIASIRWMVCLRRAARTHPTFVFFPHAGGTPLSVSRLACALPAECGVVVASLPRGDDIDRAAPPRRVAPAVRGLASGFDALQEGGGPSGQAGAGRLILVGNSYGALLAYEMAWEFARRDIPVEHLVVSGYRSPILACPDAPLHRLPPRQLKTELAARFGAAPGDGEEWAGSVLEQALRADLEACDTYRHDHDGRLAIPVTVLHMRADSSVSAGELAAWSKVTTGATRVERHAAGHFPWATHPGEMAGVLLGLARGRRFGQAASSPVHATATHDEREKA